MATADIKTRTLGSLPLFADCSHRQLQRLAELCDAVSAQAGETLCGEGKLGVEFFVIVDGRAEVQRRGEQVATLGPGDFFGELALLDTGAPPRRQATVVATTALSLYVFDARSFAGMLHDMPRLAERLHKVAGQRRGDSAPVG